ncbi:MAG: fatty acid cis/trans isomerase, partial [Gammaproteobacteria bacterium]|nr:fatty acid cis/trans isomerase [Gammaproteobacteria bacterium]
VRRSDPTFWAHSDDLFAAFETLSPVEAGRFDYNRLENR